MADPHTQGAPGADGAEARDGQAAPLWGGRFRATPSADLTRFGASLPVDRRLWEEDIAGSKAHARMLGAQGILSEADVAAIVSGLDAVADEIREGRLAFDETVDEDIHMAVERRLTELVGSAGGRLHTARSRNDQVALDSRLAAKRLASGLMAACERLEAALLARAEAERETILPGYTHLQPAQPVRLAHHLLAYFWMLSRDWARLFAARRAADASPLGSAALAGTTYPLDRGATASELGFSSVIPNSLDAVSDRDFALDLIYASAMAMLHLSRLCEELVLWSSAEFGFVTMDDAHSTGSSIMPQKKNPDFAELVRGKTGRVYGDLMALLTTMKGLPLAYDKDLQEDKEPLFDAADTARQCLEVVAGMVETLAFNRARMREAAGEGLMAATDMADYLVSKGLPFREAHGAVGRLVARCVAEGKGLEDLALDEMRAESPLFDEDVYGWIELEAVVDRRATEGGTGAAPLAVQLALAEDELARQRAEAPAA